MGIAKNIALITALGGSGGSGQPLATPDWNQNDETAADYIKNRPFYTADPVETVLVEESTVSFSLSGGLYVADFPTSFNAELGQTYNVSWDGTAYECACENYNTVPAIGNPSIIGIGPDTGEPFLIFNESGLNEAGWASVTKDTSASHIISIGVFVQEVVKIDKKYLPDTVVQPDWNQNDETAPDYIKNRPFYTTTVETELVNGLFAFAHNPNLGCYMNSDIKIELTEGETYKVMLDGVEYETVCQVFQEGMLYIGASEILNGGTPPSNMPFVYTKAPNGHTTFATTTGNSHEIIIKSIKSQIIPIPEQYIPEMNSVTLLSSTANSTKKFKITVDDSGTLKATEVTG